MTLKQTPIGEHREKDLILVRKKLIVIIKDKKSKAKDITDASKLLARMHHSLQPDKITGKLPPEEKRKPKELSDEEKREVEQFLED